MTTARDCVNVLKSVIREPYAWPGGYERAVIANDGCLICHGCCKENFRLMVHSTKGDYRDGWQVMGALTAVTLTQKTPSTVPTATESFNKILVNH
jgi:hypothetical protein